MELEPLKVRIPLVVCKKVLMYTSGFDAATPAFVAAPFVVALFNFLVTLDPIPDPKIGGASKEQ
jgi:hypothetical protein